jgi:exopolyphosphatase / guanosine-5'-triphosphate,3'-diphosphate pyrophosphatase
MRAMKLSGVTLSPLLLGGCLAFLLTLLPLGPAKASEPPFRTLAAFDVGSGSTRVLIADVAVCSGDILVVHEARMSRVPFASDLLSGNDQGFSDDILLQADRVMAEFSELASGFGAEQMIGVATQAFRRADNGQQLIDDWRRKFDLNIRIVSQDEEARLAYRLVQAKLDQPAPDLMVWDLGAGSQQLVWRNRADGSWQHHNSDIASVSFRDRATDWLDRPIDQRSPNPINAEEAERLASELTHRLEGQETAAAADFIAAGAHIVGIGGVHGASLANQLGLQAGGEIERAAVDAALKRQLGRTDDQIGGHYADTEVSNLILVGTLMDLFGINRYQVLPMDLTEAVLLEAAADCPKSRDR